MKINKYVKQVNFTKDLAAVNQILAGAAGKINFFGKRVIKVSGYKGTISLDKIARKVIASANERSKNGDLTNEEREVGRTITCALAGFYNETDEKKSRRNCLTRLFNTIREAFSSSDSPRAQAKSGTLQKLFLEGLPEPDSDAEKPQTCETIPKALDIRGKQWLTNQHICSYMNYLSINHPKLFVPFPSAYAIKLNSPMQVLIDSAILEDGHFEEGKACTHVGDECSGKTILAYPLHIHDNHWTLVLLDREARTLEYYDSKQSYGNHSEVVAHLQKLAQTLSGKDPGAAPYTFVKKINKVLQPDSYQCGPWVLYFLEKRLENPEIDFNELNGKKSQAMIADFRLNVMKEIIILDKANNP